MGQIAVSGNLEVFSVDSNSAKGWQLFPHAILRIVKFCQQYDSDADAKKLVAQLKTNFVYSEPNGYILLLLEGQTVVGHILVAMEEWFGTKMATIIQLEIDKPMDRELQKRALEDVENWARLKGATFVQCMARNDTVARAFSIYHGFTRQRIMMRKSLESPSTGLVENAGNT